MAIGCNFNYPELAGCLAGMPQSCNGNSSSAIDMGLDHLHWIHAVDVIGAEDNNIVRILVINQIQTLIDGIGATGERAGPQALLGRNRSDVVTKQSRHAPGCGDVTIQRM